MGLICLDILTTKTAGCILSCPLPWIKETNNISRLRQFEIVYGMGFAALRTLLTVLREQKSFGLIRGLVVQFCYPGDLMANFWAETMSVAQACLVLAQYPRFMGYENDKECVKQALPCSVEVLRDKYLPLKAILSQIKSFATRAGYPYRRWIRYSPRRRRTFGAHRLNSCFTIYFSTLT